MSVKVRYVATARKVRSGLRSVGVLPHLDRWAATSRLGGWTRSLLAIYDIAELAELDVPWWTYDSSMCVDAFLTGRQSARVFEWGSGASTIWLSRRADTVFAVEHDTGWAGAVRELIPADAKVDLRVIEPAAATGRANEVLSRKAGAEGLDFRPYVAAIDEIGGPFDLIVIDGRAREACLRSALRHISRDGLIVVDNVERRRYRTAIAECAQRQPMRVIWTRGLTPGLPYPSRTAILAPVGRP